MSPILAIFRLILGVIVVLTLLLLVSTWIFSPLVVRSYAPDYLTPLGLELTPESQIRLNPFKVSINIYELGLRPVQSKSERAIDKTNTITDAEANAPEASISNAVIDLNLLALIQNRIAFDQLDFEKLHLNIKRDENTLKVAGYEIDLEQAPREEPLPNTQPASLEATKLSPPAENTAAFETPASKVSKTSNKSDPSEGQQEDVGVAITQWTLDIPSLTITDFRTNIIDHEQAHSVHLEDLSIGQLELSHDWLAGKLELSALLNSAPLSLSADMNFEDQVGTLGFNATLEKLPSNQLAYLAKEQLDKLDGSLSFDIKGEAALQENGTTIKLDQSFVEANNLNLTLTDIEVRESSIRLDAQSLTLIMPSEGEISAEGAFSLNGETLEVGPSNTTDVLVAVQQLSLPEQTFSFIGPQSLESKIKAIEISGIQYSLKAEESLINTDQVAEKNVVSTNSTESQDVDESSSNNEIASTEPTSEKLPALASIDKLVVEQIAASTDELSIESIELGKLEVNALIDAQQQVINLVNLSTPQKDTEQQSTDNSEPTVIEGESATPSDEEKPFRLSLGSFSLTEPGLINLSYEGVQPAFKQSIRLEKSSLEKLDSSQPLSYSHLELAFSSNEYTRADISGEIAPFAEQTNLTLDIQLKEFMLPNISPFIRTAAGFDMSNGQLDSDTKLAIVNDEIDGVAKLEIRGLEIDNAGDVHTGSLAEKSFIPLNLALGALKDSDGRIELDVGLTGNVHGPNFGLNGFLNLIAQKAALAASESYLINTFVPYANIVTLTKIAGSYALTPRVDDLIFETGQYELTNEQTEFLDKLAALLEDKQDTDMRACGFSTYTEEEATPDTITPEQTGALRELARQRENALKTYLVSEKSVPSSRILLCGGKIDQRLDIAPRIEFTF